MRSAGALLVLGALPTWQRSDLQNLAGAVLTVLVETRYWRYVLYLYLYLYTGTDMVQKWNHFFVIAVFVIRLLPVVLAILFVKLAFFSLSFHLFFVFCFVCLVCFFFLVDQGPGKRIT